MIRRREREKQESRYGAWRSPITAALVARQSIRFGDLLVDGDDTYWVESRPAERGRSVIVQHAANGKTLDVLQPPFSARSRVHEYGGGAFTVHKRVIYFVNFDDQRIYRKEAAGVPKPITPNNGNRYADLVADENRNRIICVQETHREESRHAVNTIVSIDAYGKSKHRVLLSGSDFYSSPRLSPDGQRIAWLTWDHPNMPFDGTELWVADFDNSGMIEDAHKVAGGISESIFQPEWSPGGILYFVSDRTGWWNIYRLSTGRVEAVTEMDAEFGVPQWSFGLSTYGFTVRDAIICTYNERGIWHLASVDLHTKSLDHIANPYTDVRYLKTMSNRVVFQAGSPTEPLSVIKYDLSSKDIEILQCREESSVDRGYISEPNLIEFDTTNNLKAYGFYYPPKNKDCINCVGELPPLIVVTHGGPTACSNTSLDLKIQFWTSRGFAVLDVNYGGSTGFGRAYRERLRGNWGIVDVDDCVNGATYLVKNGLVDRNRLVIRGGSAGGYTTLAALVFREFFKAGASYYGVSDLEALAKETHKFESRYLDSLIGPYPEAKEIYKERSPINHSVLLSAPVIFFQGLDDKVVPPNQAEKMFNTLRDKGIPVAYMAFEGEQHGFRKAENLERSLEAELYFYSRIFGIELNDRTTTVDIKNL